VQNFISGPLEGIYSTTYEWICPKMGLAGVGSSALYAASPFLSWYCVVVMLWAGESRGLSLCLRGYVVVVR